MYSCSYIYMHATTQTKNKCIHLPIKINRHPFQEAFQTITANHPLFHPLDWSSGGAGNSPLSCSGTQHRVLVLPTFSGRCILHSVMLSKLERVAGRKAASGIRELFCYKQDNWLA